MKTLFLGLGLFILEAGLWAQKGSVRGPVGLWAGACAVHDGRAETQWSLGVVDVLAVL